MRQESQVAVQLVDIGILPMVAANGRYVHLVEGSVLERARCGNVPRRPGASLSRVTSRFADKANGGEGRSEIASSRIACFREQWYQAAVGETSVKHIYYTDHTTDADVSMRSGQAQASQKINRRLQNRHR